MVVYCKELTALQPCKKSSLQNPDKLPDGVHMSSSQSGFYQEPSGVSGLYQDVWGRVTGSEIVSFHISNMPNKLLWHTKHIAYTPMVQKSSVCTWQTCQIECYCNDATHATLSKSSF